MQSFLWDLACSFYLDGIVYQPSEPVNLEDLEEGLSSGISLFIYYGKMEVTGIIHFRIHGMMIRIPIITQIIKNPKPSFLARSTSSFIGIHHFIQNLYIHREDPL